MSRRTFTLASFLSLSLLILFSSCLKDEVEITRITYTDDEYYTLQQTLDLPKEVANYSIIFPKHVQQFNGNLVQQINGNKATLGRVLFYDTKLSKTQTVSCASCHLQENAFADPVALSKGFDGQLTKRNSLSLGISISTYDNTGTPFFWDGRAHSIEQQSRMTIQDPIEMGMDLKDLTLRLQGIDYYEILFQKAYGDNSITEDNIVNALSEFINSITAFDTPFDKALNQSHNNAHLDLPMLSEEENIGRAIFANNCSSCHGATLSFGFMNHANNGLDVVYEDKGMADFGGGASMEGVFKVPLLRNIELTAPYMHDGRFATLEEVIEHYSTGIQQHENLNPMLKDDFGNPRRFNFTQVEKDALIAFLKTLTDRTMTKEKKYSDPFK